MRQVANDQAMQEFGLSHGQGPGKHSAPIMGDERHFPGTRSCDEGGYIVHQDIQLICCDAERCVRFAIATQVWRPDAIAQLDK